MVDVASITVAIISLVGSIIVAVGAGFWAYYTDERKNRRETEKLLRKYRDPLLLAAQDLQARLYNITELCIVDSFISKEQKWQDTLFIYTAFLFGQYLCWTHILRRQTQFLCFVTDEKTNTTSFIRLVDNIKAVLNTDKFDGGEAPFMLWKGHQIAIGELMCVSENGELMCMGFSTFTQKWKEADTAHDEVTSPNRSLHNGPMEITVPGAVEHSAASNQHIAFRKWFEPIEDGIRAIYPRGRGQSDNRLRRLQHCLVDLVDTLDPKNLRSDVTESEYVRSAPHCPCSACERAAMQAGRDGEGRANVRPKGAETA